MRERVEILPAIKEPYTTIDSCRVCDSDVEPIMDLGKHKVSTFGDKEPPEVPLSLCMCGECGLLQLEHSTNPDLMFNEEYGYRSGVNETMRTHLKGIVDQAQDIVELDEWATVVDIGSNDGTLLGNYPREVLKVGFEPSKNVAHDSATMFIDKQEPLDKWKIFNDYFNAHSYNRNYEQRAKVVTAISMFYDLEDPNEFLHHVYNIMDNDGLLIVQQNYVGGMIDQGAVDNICHEHLEYYSLGTMEYLLRLNGLEVFDVEENDLNGGSFRTLIRKVGSDLGGNEGRERIEAMKDGETHLGQEKTYTDFAEKARENFRQLREYVEEQNQAGKRIYIYGASTRGGTLLQGAGVDSTHIVGAAERNPAKWGKIMRSTGIPMVSEEEAREDADVFIVLPWHFKEEFLEREKEFLKTGEMVFPLPEFEVIGGGKK